MVKKLLIVAAVVLVLSLLTLFLPAKELSIEGIGTVSFETTITLSVGSETAYAAPDEETRQPDGDINPGSWTTTPLWSKIDEGSAAPDGLYIICPNDVNSTGECSVQNPTNTGTYTAVQIIVYARKSATWGARRGLNADIRINGNLQGEQTLTTYLNYNWRQYTYTWSGLNFTQSDMDTLQILFTSTGRVNGGNRRAVYIDYYEVILTYAPPAPPTNWLCDFSNRVMLTIDHNDVDSPLTNFPALVYLSTSSGRNNDDVSFVFDELQSDANRYKIAVTTSDGLTQCYVEIEKWNDASEQAWLWVKVPAISDSIDTILYLYYDIDSADNTIYVGDTNSATAEMVWDSNFALVQHLGENATVVHDSTINSNDETNPPPEPPSPGYIRATYNDPGIMDGSYSFSSGSRIQMAHSSSFDITEAITLEAFVYLNDATDGKLIVKDDPFDEGGSGCYNLQQENSQLEIMLDLGGGWVRASSGAYNTGEWVYVSGTYDRNTMRLYLNGIQRATNPQTAAIRSGDTVNVALGNRADDNGTLYDLNGVLDEVRVSNTARSAAWVGASYESGRDDLIAFGPEETITEDIVNTPSSKDFGSVGENSSYWSMGSAPTFPLDDGECYFTLTNNSDCPVNIAIRATDFSGGVGWTLAGTPGINTVTLKAGQSGDAAEGNMVTLTTLDQSFISNMAESATKMWEIKLDTGTFTDYIQKTSTITLTASFA